MVKLQFAFSFVLILLLVGAPVVELIHKGKNAGPQEGIPIMPWKVGLFYTTDSTGTSPRYMCTGNILGTHWILTAAHCVQAPFRDPASEDSTDKDAKYIRPADGEIKGVIITISYGSNNLPIFNQASRGRAFLGKKVSVIAVFNQTVFVHPRYDWDHPKTSDHDIGLIYIPTGINLTDNSACTAPLDLNAGPISLPDGHPIRIAGWGRTEPYKVIMTTKKPANFSNYLSYADINGFHGSTCVAQFPQDNTHLDAIQDQDVKRKIIADLSGLLLSLSNNGTRCCGNDLNVNTDQYRAGACKGDSGGSVDLILSRTANSANTQTCCVFSTIGLVSKGFGCGDKDYPDIYQLLTVDDFAWINDTDKMIQQNLPNKELQVQPPDTTDEQHRAFLQENNRTTQNIATNNTERRCRCVIC